MSDRFLAHIAREIVGKPLLITEDKLAVIAGVLGGRIGLDDPAALALGPDASRFAGQRRDPDTREYLSYARTEAGGAVITITGSLVNRGAWIGASSGLTSYEGFKHQLASAAADGKVREIFLDMETPGGQALGMAEAAAAVRLAAAQKPVTAIVNGMAASAGYGIASGATRIVTTRDGLSGSIGVKLLHLDYSRMLDRAGVTPTLISMPDDGSKALGNPFEPLTEAAQARLKAEIREAYDQFVETVLAGRQGLSAEAVRALGAHVYPGQRAIDAGLADELGSFESALAGLSSKSIFSGAGRRASRSTTMEFTQADLDRARTEGHAAGKAEGFEAGKAEGHKAGLAEGLKTERERFGAILGADEAKGREKAAMGLATSTDMPADAVKAVLATLPQASSLADRAATVPHAGAGGAKPPAEEAA
ncbi:MAG TPA: S49 family peptidase, partial [Reyranella sp.]|nr:S49 family peptidase [Reyranella sp.]